MRFVLVAGLLIGLAATVLIAAVTVTLNLVSLPEHGRRWPGQRPWDSVAVPLSMAVALVALALTGSA